MIEYKALCIAVEQMEDGIMSRIEKRIPWSEFERFSDVEYALKTEIAECNREIEKSRVN